MLNEICFMRDDRGRAHGLADFATALATAAESDLIATMPQRLVTMHAERFAVTNRDVPLRLPTCSIRASVSGFVLSRFALPRFSLPRFALMATIAFMLGAALPDRAAATGTDPAADPQIDPAPCVAAAASDADKIIAICGALIDNEKTAKADRIKALIARAGAYDRKDQTDRAIADYDTTLRLDPTLADIFNIRGELWRKKGDRPHALADFGAAIKLNPDHPTARGNYKSLAQELERLGALMAVHNKPSFNCATARRAVEKAICGNPELANLDREINAVYTRVVRETASDSPRAGRAMQRQQDEFIARRNASFGRPDYDLHNAMKERLQHLLGVESY
jgi:tetratricopeptide (TPR) repeat protein